MRRILHVWLSLVAYAAYLQISGSVDTIDETVMKAVMIIMLMITIQYTMM